MLKLVQVPTPRGRREEGEEAFQQPFLKTEIQSFLLNIITCYGHQPWSFAQAKKALLNSDVLFLHSDPKHNHPQKLSLK